MTGVCTRCHSWPAHRIRRSLCGVAFLRCAEATATAAPNAEAACSWASRSPSCVQANQAPCRAQRITGALSWSIGARSSAGRSCVLIAGMTSACPQHPSMSSPQCEAWPGKVTRPSGRRAAEERELVRQSESERELPRCSAAASTWRNFPLAHYVRTPLPPCPPRD